MGKAALSDYPEIFGSRLALSLKRLVYNQCVLPVKVLMVETYRLAGALKANLYRPNEPYK